MPAFAAAAALGLAGGLTPGPLTALVVTETLRHGVSEGVKVALAPVLTDGPLLLGAALLAVQLEALELDGTLGVIALGGAVLLTWLGWESVRATGLDLDAAPERATGGVLRGVLTNFLNPHPYIFWVAVGGPLLAKVWSGGSALSVTAFVAGFFGALCGSKILLAVLVGRARKALSGAGYAWTVRALGVAMWGFAVAFALEGLHRLGLLGA